MTLIITDKDKQISIMDLDSNSIKSCTTQNMTHIIYIYINKDIRINNENMHTKTSGVSHIGHVLRHTSISGGWYISRNMSHRIHESYAESLSGLTST